MHGRRRRCAALVVLTSLLAAVVTAVPAGASEADSGPGRALFRGAVIDLAEGWSGARSCVVFSRSQVRCFATHTEADAMLGYSPAKDPLVNRAALAAPPCPSGWLCLYQDAYGDTDGRRLLFRDEYWNDLEIYDFVGETSAWRNNQGSRDRGHLSLFNLSSVYNCGANSYANTMGVYNDQAYAVWG